MDRSKRSPWWWVPSLYYAEGIPYITVMTVSVIMYKRLGISNTDIALYTSWLYLPWVIKPLWSPIVDIFKTKRFWIVTMQLLIGAGLGGVALTVPLPSFFQYTLAFFWLLAFSSATHDIAADGFYMLGLNQHDQAWFVGVRSTFYRFAMITGQGLLIIFAGFVESNSGLDNVSVQVFSNPQAQEIEVMHPDSLTLGFDEQKMYIVTYPETLEINTRSMPRTEVDSLLRFAYDWNKTHGFIKEEKGRSAAEIAAGPSWWQGRIVQPLEQWIRSRFGQEQPQIVTDEAGNIGVIYFHLSQRPKENQTVVMNFGRSSGDKSIFLVDSPPIGSRLEFNQRNWNKPAMAVIQLDPKLKRESNAEFTGQAGNIPLAWSLTFFFLAGLFVLFFIYHKVILPFPSTDKAVIVGKTKNIFKEFIDTFVLFFKKDRILIILGFLLLYRLAESQLVKLASPFLLDRQELGGLALTTGEVGFIYGTIGLLSLTLGGLLGGFVAARHGLKFWLWPMALAINVPNIAYIYLSYALPDNFWIINMCVAAEQFGYGFGFTAYMLYMIYVSEGDHKTSHFAITTAFMALGMMIPGMFSGWLQELIGYQHFFLWVMLATIPGFIIIALIPLDKDFGKKKEQE